MKTSLHVKFLLKYMMLAKVLSVSTTFYHLQNLHRVSPTWLYQVVIPVLAELWSFAASLTHERRRDARDA